MAAHLTDMLLSFQVACEARRAAHKAAQIEAEAHRAAQIEAEAQRAAQVEAMAVPLHVTGRRCNATNILSNQS